MRDATEILLEIFFRAFLFTFQFLREKPWVQGWDCVVSRGSDSIQNYGIQNQWTYLIEEMRIHKNIADLLLGMFIMEQ